MVAVIVYVELSIKTPAASYPLIRIAAEPSILKLVGTIIDNFEFIGIKF
jgi:hypothetical protein